MATALKLVGASLSAATLLIAAMFLLAFHLGRLITRDDEQREVKVAQGPEVAVVRRGRRAVEAPRAAHHPRARWRDGAGALRRHLDELGDTSPSCIAPRCRWLGSPPILRQDDTNVRRVFLQQVTPRPSTRSGYRRAAMMFTATGEARARMITTAKFATGTGAALAYNHRAERRVGSRPR